MKTLPGGLWPAAFTPLDENQAPDFSMVDRLVELFVEQKLDGLYVLGSTGHGPALRIEERKALARRFIRAARGRIPVMVHVGSLATEDAIELARDAADAGADAISSVPPIYYPAGADVTFTHYNRIAAATELPFYCYHASFLQATVGNAADFTRRVLEIPHIAGMKITDHDLYVFGLIHHYSAGRLRLYSGPDPLLCHAVLSGAIGAIGTFYNVFGPVCRLARSRFAAGEVAAAQQFMLAFQGALDRILASGSSYKFCRKAMRIKYGLDIGPGRAPFCAVGREWDDQEVRILVDQVDQALPSQ